jgi:hypothetical protein
MSTLKVGQYVTYGSFTCCTVVNTSADGSLADIQIPGVGIHRGIPTANFMSSSSTRHAASTTSSNQASRTQRFESDEALFWKRMADIDLSAAHPNLNAEYQGHYNADNMKKRVEKVIDRHDDGDFAEVLSDSGADPVAGYHATEDVWIKEVFGSEFINDTVRDSDYGEVKGHWDFVAPSDQGDAEALAWVHDDAANQRESYMKASRHKPNWGDTNSIRAHRSAVWGHTNSIRAHRVAADNYKFSADVIKECGQEYFDSLVQDDGDGAGGLGDLNDASEYQQFCDNVRDQCGQEYLDSLMDNEVELESHDYPDYPDSPPSYFD